MAAFRRMAPVDRRHAIGVARAVVAHLDRLDLSPEDHEARWIVAAALLHDVGKSVAGLGTYGRAVATLSGWVGGHDMAASWADTRGFTRKVGLYLQYPELGADLLRMAGSDERVVAWAAQPGATRMFGGEASRPDVDPDGYRSVRSLVAGPTAWA